MNITFLPITALNQGVFVAPFFPSSCIPKHGLFLFLRAFPMFYPHLPFVAPNNSFGT